MTTHAPDDSRISELDALTAEVAELRRLTASIEGLLGQLMGNITDRLAIIERTTASLKERHGASWTKR
ncbi:MAG: hypothetical protein IT177_01960 [Acidobacteria bacterium]|nr:hypothetical protein [Acidobacteriota bacterium]